MRFHDDTPRVPRPQIARVFRPPWRPRRTAGLQEDFVRRAGQREEDLVGLRALEALEAPGMLGRASHSTGPP